MRSFSDRLSAKLNASILIFLLLLAGVTATLVFVGFERTQSNATESSRDGLEQQAQQTLTREATFNAAFGQAQLEATAGLAQEAARFMGDAAVLAGLRPVDVATIGRAPNGVLFLTDPQRRTDVVLPASAVLDDAALRDIRDSAALEDLFPTLLQGFSGDTRSPDFDAVAIYFDSINGVTRMFPPFHDIASLPPDADVRGIVARLGPEQNPERKTIWTEPYEDLGGRGATLTALVPVYTGDEFRGTISVDLSLARLIVQVDAIRSTPSSYAFYVDAGGALLQTAAAPVVQAAIDDPENESFAGAFAAMRRGEVGVTSGELGGEDVFIAYAPLTSVGGSLALVAPVDEVTAQAAAVASSIDREQNRTLLVTLGTMLLFFIVGTGVTAWLSRRVLLRPIEALVDGTRAVAGGDLAATIPVSSGDELGVLAESFNAMTRELAVSRGRIDAQSEQLRASEAELRAVFGAMIDVVFIISREGEYLQAAPTIPALTDSMLNRTAWLIGQNVTDVLEPEAATAAVAAIAAVLDGGGTQVVEYRIAFTETYERWFSAAISRKTADTVLWVARDVTQRRRDEQRLAEREQQYRSIFESTSDALFITDLEDRIVDANPAACEMHGFTLDEMRAMPPFTLLHPNSRLGAGEYLRELGAGRAYRARARHLRKDGSSFPIDALGTPIVYRGEPHVLVVVRDITEQVQSERLLEQRVTDRTRELASLLEVSRNVSSELDQARLLDVILTELQTVVPFDRAAFMLLEGEELVATATHDADGRQASRLLGTRFGAGPQSTLWQVIRRGDPVIIGDVLDDSEMAGHYRGGVAGRVDPWRGDVRSWMAVPLLAKDRVVGVLTLARAEPNAYEEHHGELAAAFASHAAIALENAELFERTEARSREVQSLLDVAQNVAATLDLDQLVRQINDELEHLIGYTGASVLIAEGNELVIRHSRPVEEGAVGMRFPLDTASAFGVVARGEPIIVDDVRGDSAYAQAFRLLLGPAIDWAAFRNVKSWMGIPMMLHDRPVGLISMSHTEPAYFTAEHARLTTGFASHAAIAVENARLFRESAQRARELASLLHVSQAVSSTLDLRELAAIILDELVQVADFTGATLAAVEGDELVILDSWGPYRGEVITGPTSRVPLLVVTREFWTAMESGVPMVIDDVQDGSPAAQLYRRMFRPFLDLPSFRTIRSWLAVPLMRQGDVIGTLTAAHESVGHFTAEVAGLVSAAASQAAVAIENARLFAQTEQRTRELAALLEISKDVASTLELRPLLSTVLDEMKAIADYDRSSILVLDGDELEILDSRAGPDLAAGAVIGTRIPLSMLKAQWDEISSGRPVFIDDVRVEDDPLAESYRNVAGELLESAFKEIHSWLGVPLILQGRVMGLLTLSKNEAAFYGERQASIAMTIANQAAIAIENARLYEETQQQGRETEALLRADAELFRSLDLDAVLRAIADVTVDVLRADKSILTMTDKGSERVRASRNFSESGVAMINAYLRNVGPDRVMRPFELEDVRDDPRPNVREIWVNESIASYTSIPIIANGVAIGGFGAGYRERHVFNDNERRVFGALAERSAAAIQNAELYERAQQVASLEERQRLARELHDSVSQALYGIALGARTARTQLDRDPAKAVEPVDYVLSLAEAGLAEMRALIFELRPESLELEGLIAGLEKQAAALRARHSVEVEAELCDEPDVPLAVKEAISRIAQEAMHNTVKHAHATRVALRLTCDDKAISLEVEDNGKGFDPTQPFAGHLGLRSMRERAANLGGQTTIESEPDKGASIRVTIPYAPA